jgi:hypothetical protein
LAFVKKTTRRLTFVISISYNLFANPEIQIIDAIKINMAIPPEGEG